MVTTIERCVATARQAGAPRSQVENFLSANYVPFPWQWRFHAAARLADVSGGPDEIGCGGSRGPGKSYAILAQMVLDDARRLPGFKGLYLRKVGKQAREQFDDLRRRLLQTVPHKYNRHEGLVTLWSDSRIVIGHFLHEKDIDSYLGFEYDSIAIEEATTLTLVKYRALRDSNRTSKPGWRPRIYSSTNPGGVGHAWYWQKFVKPFQTRQEGYTRFFPATVDDNPVIDKDYQRKLEENVGWRLQAYRHGNWDIAAGQFFTTWRQDAHVVPTPASPPHHWLKWCSLDYGFTHPTVVYLFGKDDNGDVYVIDEHRQAKWLVSQHAEAVHALLARNNTHATSLRTFPAGHDVFARRGESEKTVAEQYAERGLMLERAHVDRVNGAAEVLRLLGNPAEGIRPRLYIYDRCRHLINCLPTLEHDPNRPEDVLKTDVDEDGNEGDDPYDSLRYGIMATPGTNGFVWN
jgi:hypothetical protein